MTHPLREEIIAAWGADFDALVDGCLAPPPQGGKPVFYQKHMTHHMLQGFDRSWRPRDDQRLPDPLAGAGARELCQEMADGHARSDIGFVEQAEIFDLVAERLGKAPPVVDADDVLERPAGRRSGHCARRCGIAFRAEMLAWPAGPKPFDGVWAPHWYNAVWQLDRLRARGRPPSRCSPRASQQSPRRRGPITRGCYATGWSRRHRHRRRPAR